ncbi:MAG TPA: hypothetical protein VNX68_00995 [Nitrosopumilaceae archaeon]|nr:hypothetical protein [Nitrosopumilaceae archaeon]
MNIWQLKLKKAIQRSNEIENGTILTSPFLPEQKVTYSIIKYYQGKRDKVVALNLDLGAAETLLKHLYTKAQKEIERKGESLFLEFNSVELPAVVSYKMIEERA